MSSLIRLTRHCGNSPGSGSFSGEVWLSGRSSARGRLGIGLAIAGLALTIGLAGLARPQCVRLIYVGWMILAFPIGWTVSQIILAAIFLGLFTPISLVFRLLGRDALHRVRQSGLDSYWLPKPRRLTFGAISSSFSMVSCRFSALLLG